MLTIGSSRRVRRRFAAAATRLSRGVRFLCSAMHLFKYLEPKYAEVLIEFGEVKIGTLYEFRESEDARADKLEGSRQFRIDGRQIHSSDNSEEAAYLRSQGFENCYFENQNSNGALFVTERLCADSYIYCASASFDEVNLRKFGGACVKIKNASVFRQILTAALVDEGLATGAFDIGAIHYCPRDKVYRVTEDMPQTIPGWLIKPSLYSTENEVRMMWEGTAETDLKPALTKRDFVQFRTLKSKIVRISALSQSRCIKRIA